MSTQAVGSTNTATNSTSASGTSGTNTLSQNNFLQLLMTQLKNQNPLDPTDTNQMVTEMSELTSVQAITGMATDIGNLTATMQAGAVGQWTSSIGDYMQVSTTSVSQGESVTLSPTGSYDSLTLTLKDSSGTTSAKTFSSSQTPVYNDIDWELHDRGRHADEERCVDDLSLHGQPDHIRRRRGRFVPDRDL